MRVSALAIKNFRSIKTLTMSCGSTVTLLGANNHGKSNILSALEFALTSSSKPSPDDFFAHRDEDVLWVEVTFSELTEQEAKTFERYVDHQGTVCIRKTCRMDGSKLEISYNGYVEEPEDEWLKAANAGNYNSRDKIADVPLVEFVPADGRVTKALVEEAQTRYIEAHRDRLTFSRSLEAGPLLGQKTVASGVLPDLFLIPAVKDLTDEVKVKATTTFGRLMGRAIRDMAETDSRLGAIQRQLEEVTGALNDRSPTDDGEEHQLAALESDIERELEHWGVKVNIEVTAPEIERLFESGTTLHVDDGTRTSADRKGHGLQRAMIFALLRAWASRLRKHSEDEAITPRKRSNSVIFAIEEPELFLHPHAQRRLSQSLREIAGTADHQVFVCTHSTHFVDLARYQDVVIVSKSAANTGTKIRQCTRDLFEGEDVNDRKKRFHMAQWVNPDRAEMFFARRVVFVEGETEQVMIPFLAERLGCLDSDVSIIDCGSKFNLPLYATIAEAFQIPYLVVHDEDPLPEQIPEEWNEDKRKSKQRTFEMNQIIADCVSGGLGAAYMVADDLETASGVSKTQGKNKGKALAALDHFETKAEAEIPQCLVDIVRLSYEGRQNG